MDHNFLNTLVKALSIAFNHFVKVQTPKFINFIHMYEQRLQSCVWTCCLLMAGECLDWLGCMLFFTTF